MAKRYKCPYCEKRLERDNLITHVEDNHEDLIPENYTPRRVVFNSINNKTSGTCIVCGKITDWNEKSGKYNRLCNNPRCREKLREEFKRNAMEKDGTYNYAASPEFQEKMLRGRKISSTYKFTDGGKVDYVGSYEKKFLEFIDKVMEIESKDIIGPGPTIEYQYNGQIHYWITDFYYVPANLVLDIKDGGKNPNNRPMEEYREKQIAKENAIKSLRKYNYLRLTDNDFSQFMETLVDIKSMALDLAEKKMVTRINESSIEELSASMMTVPPKYSTDANVMIANSLHGGQLAAISPLDFNDTILIDDDEEGIKKISKKEFIENYTIKAQFLYPKNEKYYNLLEVVRTNSDDIYKGIYANLSSFDIILTEEQIYFDKEFKQLMNKGLDKDTLALHDKVSTINSALELDIGDGEIAISFPDIDDNDYKTEYLLKNDKPTLRMKAKDNSVIATINKSIEDLTPIDQEKIEESMNILAGGE